MANNREQTRFKLNNGFCYEHCYRQITIEGVKQKRPSQNFLTLYQLTAGKYTRWHGYEESTKTPTITHFDQLNI